MTTNEPASGLQSYNLLVFELALLAMHDILHTVNPPRPQHCENL